MVITANRREVSMYIQHSPLRIPEKQKSMHKESIHKCFPETKTFEIERECPQNAITTLMRWEPLW